jgi:branched-subunit amino acid aminotransferase/4-amino-4-deoxychorismate lyase
MLIWHRGRVCESTELQVSLEDPVFEHGLGLFETLRTWRYDAPLLPRHLSRLTRSSELLRLQPLSPRDLPTAEDVAELVHATGGTDSLVRITRTAGSANLAPVLWMRCTALPPSGPVSGLTLIDSPWRIDHSDPLARHKSLNYWLRRLAFEYVRSVGGDEALLLDQLGRPWEGSRTNLFIVRDGILTTPTLEGPIVPGIMRSTVLEAATDLNIRWNERVLEPIDLRQADEIFVTNSVRLILPVARVNGSIQWHSRGMNKVTRALDEEVRRDLGADL